MVLLVKRYGFDSGAPAREARPSGAPWVSKSTYPRKFGNHVIVHRTNERPSVRTTGIPMKNLGLSVIAMRVLDPGNEVVFLARKRVVTAFC